MLKRAQLVSRWQSKLDENRRLFLEGSPRLQWLRRMQIRLFHFLVSNYGGDDSTIVDDLSKSETRGSSLDATGEINVGLTDLTGHHEGSPPKSNAAIRATLKSVYGANNKSGERGPLAHGLGESDWIIVETYRHRDDAREFCERLRWHEIRYARSITHGGKRHVISVRMCDKDRAESLLVPQRRRTPQELKFERAAAMSRVIGRCAIAALFGLFALIVTAIVVSEIWNARPITAATVIPTATILGFLMAYAIMCVRLVRI